MNEKEKLNFIFEIIYIIYYNVKNKIFLVKME